MFLNFFSQVPLALVIFSHTPPPGPYVKTVAPPPPQKSSTWDPFDKFSNVPSMTTFTLRLKLTTYPHDLGFSKYNNLAIPNFYTFNAQCSIRYQDCKLWNELPIEIKNSDQNNYRNFLKYVKTHLHNNQR